MNDAETALRLALDGRQSVLWTAIPCLVESVDLEAMTLIAQPTIQGTVEDENGRVQSVNLPLLEDVPIVFPSGGGFCLTFPIQENDEVLVIFASRCIDAWWQSGGIQRPMEMRMHDLSDGFAIPGIFSQPRVLSDISASNVQLRNEDGETYVELTDDGTINLVSPTEVHVEGDLTISGDLSVQGEISANGSITSQSDISALGDVIAGAISLKNHTHAVTTAPGTTGPALP